MYQHESAGIETSEKGHGFVATRAGRAPTNHTEQRGPLGEGGANHNAYYSACDSIPATHAKNQTEREKSEMKKSIRGMGRTFLRGRVYDFLLSPWAGDPRKLRIRNRSLCAQTSKAAVGRDVNRPVHR